MPHRLAVHVASRWPGAKAPGGDSHHVADVPELHGMEAHPPSFLVGQGLGSRVYVRVYTELFGFPKGINPQEVKPPRGLTPQKG